MEKLLRNWNIGRIECIEPVGSPGGRSVLVQTVDGRRFYLKEKTDRLKAEREYCLLFNLSKLGAPVAVPICNKYDSWCAVEAGRIYCLYPRLAGEIISEHYGGNASTRAGRFGRAIAFLHTRLLQCEHVHRFPGLHLLDHIREWALPRLRRNVDILDADRLERTWTGEEKEMSAIYPDLPVQLIHRDAHPGNMLFEGDRLSGWVDFDQVVRGPRLFDPCYCGTSLLVGGFSDETKRRAWPKLFHGLIKGYESINPLRPAELKSIHGTLIAIELLFAAFSLENGDEQAARQNEAVVYWLEENRAELEF